VRKKIVGKFEKFKMGLKWEYATIKLRAPAGWLAFKEYNHGPSLYYDGNKLTIYIRRERKKN
jgi:hypothetical protein